MSCTEKDKLGTGLVVPARAECCEPGHLVEEAECLWAAERDKEERSGICGKWGRVCILANPDSSIPTPVLGAWRGRVEAAGVAHSPLSRATDEKPVLDAATGCALFDWPTDDETKRPLETFDLLLMTATEPVLTNSQYASTKEIAKAWIDDNGCNVAYFFNNRHHGITTFEDDQILTALRGGA